MYKSNIPSRPTKQIYPAKFYSIKNQDCKKFITELINTIDSLNEEIWKLSSRQAVYLASSNPSLAAIMSGRCAPQFPIQQTMSISAEKQELNKKLDIIKKALEKVNEHNFKEIKEKLSNELEQINDPIASLKSFLKK